MNGWEFPNLEKPLSYRNIRNKQVCDSGECLRKLQRKNEKSLMIEKYLPNSEVYIAEETDNVLGFNALSENYIASIFVDIEQQGRGIRTLLLNYAKNLRTELKLNVYQKNEKSVSFYKSKGFIILSESIPQHRKAKTLRPHRLALFAK